MDSNFLVDGTPLPDARLDLWARRKRTEFVYANQTFELVYCVNCGVSGGAVYKGCPVFYLCTECVTKYGPPPGVIEVSPDGV